MFDLVAQSIARRDGGALGTAALLALITMIAAGVGIAFLTHALWTYIALSYDDLTASVAISGIFLVISVISLGFLSWHKAKARRRMSQTAEPLRALLEAFLTGQSAGRALRR